MPNPPNTADSAGPREHDWKVGNVTIVRRIGSLAAALFLVGAAISPVLATDIKASQVPTDAASAQQGTDEECSGFDQEGMVLWHFVLIDQGSDVPAGGWGTVTLTASFDTDNDGLADTDVTATQDTPVDTYVYHFDVITPDDWVLITASTDKGGPEDTDTRLLLSHVCIGPPPPVIPEAPLALLLPLVAIGTFGFYLLRSRRASAPVA
jgi:hypothetical protein